MAGSVHSGESESVRRRRGQETLDVPAPGEHEDDEVHASATDDGMGSPSTDVGRADASERDRPSGGAPVASTTPKTTQRLGRFTILGTLGEGGMGTVLRAYDDTLGRMVAVKLLRKSFVEERQQRLLREAQALARLSHPNVVQVYEIGVVEGLMFIAMELVSGTTLDIWQRQSRSWTEILDAYLQAGRGLAAAHERGLIHRDFKPENCIIGDDGRVRVLDFGLALSGRFSADERLRESPRSRTTKRDDSQERRLTQSGVVIGTLHYLPLQQLSGESADAASDQYSFCVSLYEGLYGSRPFNDASLSDLLVALQREDLLPVPKTAVPSRLRRIVLRGLAKDPEDRWPGMEELLEALERLRRPRRWPMFVAGSTLAAGLGAGAWIMASSGGDPCADPGAGLQQTWGPTDRGTVRAAFLASGHPEAPRLYERARGSLDDYAADWVQMAERSCRATFIEHQQSEVLFDRRVQCLQRRRSRLRTTIDSMAEATTAQQVVDRTILPFKLPSLQPCADVDALMARRPIPSDPTVRARASELRTRIDQANTLREAGELDRGVELAMTLVAEARALDDPTVLAEALECLGHLQSNGGSGPQEARATLDEAIEVAARAQADQIAARAWALLLYALMREGRLDEGIAMGRAARAAAVRSRDEIARGWMLNNLGALHGERGDLEQSQRYLQQALEVKRQALHDDHFDVGIAWFNLGHAQLRQGAADQAQRALSRAQSIFEITVGQSHPYMAAALAGLGSVASVQGLPSEAARYHLRALVIRRTALGPEHVLIARSLRDLGEAELVEGRLADARLHLERALWMMERMVGADDAQTSHIREALARLERATARPTEQNENENENEALSVDATVMRPGHETGR